MAQRKFATYNFSGGYNSSANSSQIGDNQCSYGKNWDFKVSSEKDTISIVKRPGATHVMLIAGTSSTSTDRLFVIGNYQRTNGEEYAIGLTGNATTAELTYFTGSSSTSMGSHADYAGTNGDTENYIDKLYIVKDGGKYLEIGYSSGITVSKYTLTDVDSNTFVGTMIKEFEDRMYIAGDTTNPHRLYISVVGDPTDFLGTGAGYINFPSQITGLGKAESFLVIHTKNHGCFKVLFNSTGEPYRLQIPNTRGTVSHKSIAEIDNVQVFITKDGVYRLGYRQYYPEEIGISKLSEDIEADLENVTDRSECAGYYKDNKYYLSYRTDSSSHDYTDHIIVYDFTAQGWTAPWVAEEGHIAGKGMWGADHIFEYDDKLFIAQKELFDNGTNYSSKGFYFTKGQYNDAGYTDPGTLTEFDSINLIYRTKAFSHNSEEFIKYWYTTTSMYIKIDEGHPVLLVRADDKADEYYERDLSNITGSIAANLLSPYLGGHPVGMAPFGGAGTIQIYQSDRMNVKTGTPVNGIYAYVQFTNDDLNKSIELLGFGLEYREMPDLTRARYNIY